MEKGFYLVGGAVRDKLMGIEPKDHDYLAVGYTAEEMEMSGFIQVGADFPVYLHPETNDEYALPRTERSTGNSYNDFVCNTSGVTVEEDLERRDLTINAMCMTPNGDLIDPYGGFEDIKSKILRHTSPAFKEDPLRVLRIARFRARFPDFSIAEETKEFISEMKDMLHHLTKERVFKELEKALSEKAPHMFFITLQELGVLQIVFPELHAMTTVDHNNVYHMEGSVFNHSMLVLKEASKLNTDTVIRFAALYHDIGKVPSFKENQDFYSHSDIEIVDKELDNLKRRYKIPNKYKKMARQVALLHHVFQNIEKMKAKTIVKKFTQSFFPKNENELRNILIACQADSFGRIILKEGDFQHLDLYTCLGIDREYSFEFSYYISGKIERSDFIDIEKIVAIFKAIKFVNLKDLDMKDMSVEDIKQELYLRRIRAVKACLRSFK